mmetsp:Transcript_26493/g.83977  ORF Transcript_26493/g.83977 Transcript_26493/m.83977 type:complete len:295 (-) Transcript_26493:1144-2028(-)
MLSCIRAASVPRRASNQAPRDAPSLGMLLGRRRRPVLPALDALRPPGHKVLEIIVPKVGEFGWTAAQGHVAPALSRLRVDHHFGRGCQEGGAAPAIPVIPGGEVPQLYAVCERQIVGVIVDHPEGVGGAPPLSNALCHNAQQPAVGQLPLNTGEGPSDNVETRGSEAAQLEPGRRRPLHHVGCGGTGDHGEARFHRLGGRYKRGQPRQRRIQVRTTRVQPVAPAPGRGRGGRGGRRGSGGAKGDGGGRCGGLGGWAARSLVGRRRRVGPDGAPGLGRASPAAAPGGYTQQAIAP